MYVCRYIVTELANTNKEKKGKKGKKKGKGKEKEIHKGFVGIGGRLLVDHSINRNQGTYLM